MKAIIFDLDGTLINSANDINDSINQALELHHFPLVTSLDTMKNLGYGAYALIEKSLPSDTTLEDIKKVFTDYELIYSKNKGLKTVLYPGICELISYLLKNNYRLAIVSNKADHLVKKINQIMFSNQFIAIGERKNVPKKPHKDLIDIALVKLGVTANNAIYIGDTEVDMLTAKNSQLKSIGVTWGFRDRTILELSGADVIVDTPQEIISLLNNIK